ncbi:hypothetical protein [Streptomyces sp. NBC_00470]|uniref:hypothetical protein n=1 Tax=Streptomyces sp. NBC_00470 TaxID=2975753 RepID=UPI002F910833
MTDAIFAADGVAAGLDTSPRPAPRLDAGALAESIRGQVWTWAGPAFQIPVPGPEMVAAAPAHSVAELVGEMAERVRVWGVQVDGGAESWGLVHLFNAHAEALWAARGRGDGHLLGALYSLIAARAHLRDGYDGRIELDPFADDRRPVDETALLETIRVQLDTWVPDAFGTIVQLPRRRELRDAADLSDVIGYVLGAVEAKHGAAVDDADSVRGLAHLANARAHGLKAGHGHGDGHLLAALDSLVLAAANLA